MRKKIVRTKRYFVQTDGRGIRNKNMSSLGVKDISFFNLAKIFCLSNQLIFG